ncbi:MAG TPA: hypothetical protein DCE42_22710 [Myxococcales bacterium]|nr:hypothetical protein [Deltaproteobacteria bacterium]MBU50309.1 hypothetical protein [Deltaproteobacteria bacterium]HAA57596.1 hypothetical protein [Myxococcales bacterium]|tara:strand:- start:9483 stop:9743 length:261 start_codon:yes stop_codon:yes gene_type:complete
MGSITISFIHDPETNRKELWVDYESSEDWMPAEHERRHKQIVRELVDQGKLEPSMVDRIHVRVEGEEMEVEEIEENINLVPQSTKT